ncbi:hypothetical protein BKA14_002294 [Actinoplanes abujensis]|uniref:Uncharacterized protein n=1 Tax=Paractinoplanes abujensis TaxID=882441 RepID=A0A7W7CP71_9ACTN|nr:hypothetical protein [Actinoplanes abujensis]
MFAHKVFRYASDDRATHEAAVAYGLGVGVPQQQLDWEG